MSVTPAHVELPRDDKGKPTARIVFGNNFAANKRFKYDKNRISTAKYNIFTFLPKNLWEQFQRLANVYFVCLLILQLIPVVSALNPVTTAFPLVVVLALTAIKDGVDDYKRHQSDKEINNRMVEVLRDDGFHEEEWHRLYPGDIVRMENNTNIPADILILNSGSEGGTCYVETAELDGETNLKLRMGLKCTYETLVDEKELHDFKGFVTSEPPNNDLHAFSGKIRLQEGGESFSLDADQLLLRGMKLRNSQWVVGIVIFAGHDTKLMQNASGARFKRTQIDVLMNTLIIYIFGILAILCLISAIASGIWEANVGEDFQTYLPWDDLTSPAAIGAVSFFTFIILYNTLVPISLYVSVEFIRLGQSFLIDWDLEMYDEATNSAAKARTTTLNEELGQVNYIFSDKTGTLTQNVMKFMKCSIQGVSYGKGETEASRAEKMRKGEALDDDNVDDVNFKDNPWVEKDWTFTDKGLYDKAKHGDGEVSKFFRLLAVCHTVQTENEGKDITYAAQSPDEAALVSAARNFGYVFLSRTATQMTIEINGKEEVYEILNVLEFNSDRKRMSIILRCPDGKIRIFTKGADNIMAARTAKNEKLELPTQEHLQEFASAGLRTLVLADKELSEEEYAAWNTEYSAAKLELENRLEKVDAVSEKIEVGLNLIGATAIEDKLQDQVPQTIANLRKAFIKIWVLTGDKQETAINIGFACQLLHTDQQIFVLNETSKVDTLTSIQALREQAEMLDDHHEKALVIDGPTLAFALDDDIKLELLDLASICRAVVCCRVTPLQKANVVRLVKDHRKAVTLAIGDGANDVSMIQAAHIGIGISGLEGRQAVLASDYSFAQFRFLERLLLVHGRWSYMRMAKFLRYFFYKNFAFTLCQFWYAIFSGWSGQTIFDAWFVTFYNVIFTSLPILAVGCFEKDVNAKMSLRHPEMYRLGQENALFSKKVFFQAWWLGVVHSLILFFIPYGAVADLTMPNGQMGGYEWFSATISCSIVILVNLILALEIYNWTFVNHCFIWLSAISWFIFGWYMYSIPILIPAIVFYGVMFQSQGRVAFWFTVLLAVTLCLLPYLMYKYYHVIYEPTSVDIVREKSYLEYLQRLTDKERQKKGDGPLLVVPNSGQSAFQEESIGIPLDNLGASAVRSDDISDDDKLTTNGLSA